MIRLVVVSVLLSACTATVGRDVSVIERADNLSASPEWASFTKSHYEEGGILYFVGFSSLPADVNISAALNVSDEKALSEPMRSLVDSFLDQNQVGETLRDDTVSQRVISATRGYRPPMPGLHITKRYWESVAITVEGVTKTELRCFSLAEIPAGEFSKAKSQYLARLSGNQEVKQILKEVGEQQREALAH